MSVSQAQFREGLFDPKRAAPTGLVNPDGTQASKRFDVYRNNVAVSLTEALEATFPVVRKLVGEAFFSAMSGVYLRQHPPTSPLLMLYGEKMPQFLRRFEPAKTLPYLSDVAWVEDVMRRAYHAADAAPIDAQTLAGLAPERLMGTKFTFAPATQALISDFPIYSIYRANTVEGAPNAIMRPEAILISRPQFDPQQTLITASAATCIASLIEGHSLGVAMTAAGDDLDLGETLGLLLAQGCITSLS